MWMLYMFPVIIGVVYALFFDEINKLLNENKELKKVVLVFVCGVIAIWLIVIVISLIN